MEKLFSNYVQNMKNSEDLQKQAQKVKKMVQTQRSYQDCKNKNQDYDEFPRKQMQKQISEKFSSIQLQQIQSNLLQGGKQYKYDTKHQSLSGNFQKNQNINENINYKQCLQNIDNQHFNKKFSKKKINHSNDLTSTPLICRNTANSGTNLFFQTISNDQFQSQKNLLMTFTPQNKNQNLKKQSNQNQNTNISISSLLNQTKSQRNQFQDNHLRNKSEIQIQRQKSQKIINQNIETKVNQRRKSMQKNGSFGVLIEKNKHNEKLNRNPNKTIKNFEKKLQLQQQLIQQQQQNSKENNIKLKIIDLTNEVSDLRNSENRLQENDKNLQNLPQQEVSYEQKYSNSPIFRQQRSYTILLKNQDSSIMKKTQNQLLNRTQSNIDLSNAIQCTSDAGICKALKFSSIKTKNQIDPLF